MKKTRRIATILLGLLALLALLVWAFSPRPVPVELTTVSRGHFESSIDDDGMTRVHDRYTITSPLSGRLKRVSLREGDPVKAGMVVAVTLPTLSPMLDQRSLAELSTRIEAADAKLAYSQTGIDRSRIAVERARDDLSRSERLLRDAFVSASKVRTDRLALAAAEQELASAIQARHVALHELDQAKAAMTAVKQAPGATDDGGFRIVSPVDGDVLRVVQASETNVATGTPILDIGDTRRMEVIAPLVTTDALAAKPGTPVRIENWGGATPLVGRVRLVEPAAFTKVSALGVEEQRVNVIIDFTSPYEQWRALGDGYRVGVRIITLAQDQVLRVPVSAVFPQANGKDPNAMACFVVRSGRAHLQPVTVAARNGIDAMITAGLAAGDQVVVYPGDAVSDGTRVTARSETSGN